MAFCLSAFVFTACDNNDTDNQESQLRFVLNEDGETVSVAGIGMYFKRNLVIPETYKGYPVTEISDMAFYATSSITSIEIPHNIKSIGKGAFYGCTGLKSVTMSNGVESIGDSAFLNCQLLTSVAIPNSVK